MSARSGKLSKTLTVVFLAAVMAACSGKKGGADGSEAGGSGGVDVGGETSSMGAGGDGGLTAEEMAARDRMLGNVIYFEFDQSTITEESRAKLDALADRTRDSGQIRLEGHADERGTPEYNLALGERRAKAVANYLALKGVDRARIEAISYGEERPAALGQDEQSYAANRRVEVK